jgi:membrane-associated phospholipid phosphatase
LKALHVPPGICGKWFRIFVLVLLGAALSGCGTVSGGRGWGSDARLLPGWDRVKSAATRAALSPETWVPAAGALVFQAADWDEDVSAWAFEHTPLYGSREGASGASGYLMGTVAAAYMATALAAPGGATASEAAQDKARGLAVGGAATVTDLGLTLLLKDTTNRERPDRSDDRSFPSGHASVTATLETLASRNLDYLSLSKRSRTLLRVGLASVTAGTAWARVEAGRHFPSDVLAGIALGHFLGAFFNDAFVGAGEGDRFALAVEPSREGVMLSLRWAY